jgi:acid phosphatase type 7
MLAGGKAACVALLCLWVGAGLTPSCSPAADRGPSAERDARADTVAVLVGAGDIADCGSSGDEATAALLDGIAGTVFTVGDNAYGDGTPREFARCYDPTWGRHKARTRPSPGNHDYETGSAAGYYGYFGARAGPAGRGYYSFDLGDWHVISLNSNIGMSAGSPQVQWLRADLAVTTKRCVLAYWHHPRFSSGIHGSTTRMTPLWNLLAREHADVVLAAHDHHYERFAPVDGIRSFVVGTGGAERYPILFVRRDSVLHDTSAGVLRLGLGTAGYTWRFLAAGGGFSDAGRGSCR